MADEVVPMDVRSMIIAWPKNAPRGAVRQFCRENEVSRSRFYEIRARAEAEPVLSALQPKAVQRGARHSQAIDIELEELGPGGPHTSTTGRSAARSPAA